MEALNQQLRGAVEAGDAAAVLAALACGADGNAPTHGSSVGFDTSALHAASAHGHAECVAALLEGGADPNRRDSCGRLPLLWAAARSGAGGDAHQAVVTVLLAGGADPSAHAFTCSFTAAHFAAATDSLHILRQLLAADPLLALRYDKYALTPLGQALHWARLRGRPGLAVARCLLEEAPLQPAGEVLESLAEAAARGHNVSSLYAPLVARQPLTAAEWALVPTPCANLAPALPAVLARSAAEAGLLVQHLPLADRERLRTAALCLARLQRRHDLSLPLPISQHLLLAVA